MLKEIVITLIIIILIIVGNFLVERYVEKTIQYMLNDLSNLKDEISKNRENILVVSNNVHDIDEKWDKTYNKLAYYIEHNELEKIELNLIEIKSYIEAESYEESVVKVDSSIFWLNHIKEKYKFSLINIF